MKKAKIWVVVMCMLFTANALAGTVELQSIGGSGSAFRWMDIADFLYSENYRNNFTYDQPTVSLTFCDISNAFAGTLTAAGLKPNFAYQMKLVGKPVKVWDGDGDDWANEQIGYAGRWWRKQPNAGNANDADYEAHKDDPDYIYEGYLLFGFFVTDAQGDATLNFAADSSFHVLWATHDSTGDGTGHRDPGPNDSPVAYYDFSSSPMTNPGAYDTYYGDAHVGIYAEWEPGRALPGELVLTAGEYNCQFILTEESFHQSGPGGGWASVLGSADIQFDLVAACEYDLNGDGDVDGSDLYQFAADLDGLTPPNIQALQAFAADYGRADCRLCP
jgi:hypothetical protein